jgi:hypothetical protein
MIRCVNWIYGQFLFWSAHYSYRITYRVAGESEHKIWYWLADYYQWAMGKSYNIDEKYKFNWWKLCSVEEYINSEENDGY